MKPTAFLLAALLAAVSIPGISTAAEVSTGPVGFQSIPIKAGQFNLVGVNFLRPVLTAGALESASGNTLVDDGATFTTVLAGATGLWVEITNGNGAGASSRVTSFTATSLTTEDDLSSFVVQGSSYSVRAAYSVAGLFGAANDSAKGADVGSTEVGLKSGNVNTADVIWIPVQGGFIKVYYATAAPPFTTAGWKTTSTGNADASATPIFHSEGIFIERRGTTDLKLGCLGDVKKIQAKIGVSQGFNYVNRIFPVGATLGNSGLASTLRPGNASTADIVWLPNTTGGYDKYYYASAAPPFTTEGWKGTSTGNVDKSGTTLTSGFIIERRGTELNVTISPDPAIYGGL
ncbi:hypothetical protein [Verrucomicrobium sp. BvORR106]|uniref:hypothetical protein n=1 Tax=Verrucomicrobium sp. BvORR106 TaxID=1403819 RepID=UPI00056EE08F|nr:hypothetical protein [Verrucomicrobium sp. BvORR106]